MAKAKGIKYRVIDGTIILKRPAPWGELDCIPYPTGSEVELSEAEYNGVADKVALIETKEGEEV